MLTQDTVNNLQEIRLRLIYCLLTYLVLFVVLFYSAHSFFNLLAEPLLRFLPNNSSLIASHIISGVTMPIKLSMNLAFFGTIPIVFYHIWQFIAPGLYPEEKKYIIPLVTISIILFLIGITFAYFIVLPMMFNVFVAWLPANVAIMTDINNYLDFVFNIFLAFGLIFEVPLVIIILTKFGVITAQKLIDIRPYFVISAFVVSMLITPPDVLSMIMMAIPICLLYELGILIAKFSYKPTTSNTYMQ